MGVVCSTAARQEVSEPVAYQFSSRSSIASITSSWRSSIREGGSRLSSESARSSTRESSSRRSITGRRRRQSTKRASAVSSESTAEAVSLELGAEAAAAAPPSRRLLVTGTESSGKTTLIRQLRLVIDGDVSEEERRKYTREVRKAALAAAQTLARQLHADTPLEEDIQTSKTQGESPHTDENSAANSTVNSASNESTSNGATKKAPGTCAYAAYKAALERVLELKPRQMSDSSASEAFRVLLENEQRPYAASVDKIEPVERRQSCAHFVSRLLHICAADFVPEHEDILHVNVPTSGEQETRLQALPGGELGMLEMGLQRFLDAYEGADASGRLDESGRLNEDGGVDENGEASNEAVGTTRAVAVARSMGTEGVHAVILVASAIDVVEPPPSETTSIITSTTTVSTAMSTTVPTSPAAAPVASMRPACRELLCRVLRCTAAAKVPCFVILSKGEVLSLSPSPLQPLSLGTHAFENLVRSATADAMEATGRNEAQSDEEQSAKPQAVPASKPQAPPPSTTAADSPVAAVVQSANLLDEDSARVAIRAVLRGAFSTDEEEDDEQHALSEGVYLGLAHLATTAQDEISHVLVNRGSLPLAQLCPEPLSLADHQWLQQLPQPLPNPRRLSAQQAEALGRGSNSPLKARFWGALCALATPLGNPGPEHLGVLHARPLLAQPGAAMMLICRVFAAEGGGAKLHPGCERKLRWQPFRLAAAHMAAALSAAELHQFKKGQMRSYLPELEVLKKMDARQLHPQSWLPRLARPQLKDTSLEAYSPGVYVAPFYLWSSLQGFNLLLPELDQSMLPAVKISNTPLGTDEWRQIRELTKKPDEIPRDWAKAKSWLGPDVSSEEGFSLLHKFFYGVVSLRQRLGRSCSPMKDELRYSNVEDAHKSLEALGDIFTDEIITIAPGVQMIMLTKYYGVECADAFPANVAWYPLELFEARHFGRFVPDTFQRYCYSKHVLAEMASQKKRRVEDELRTSGHSSADSCCSDDSNRSSKLSTDISTDLPPKQSPVKEAAKEAGDIAAAARRGSRRVSVDLACAMLRVTSGMPSAGGFTADVAAVRAEEPLLKPPVREAARVEDEASLEARLEAAWAPRCWTKSALSALVNDGKQPSEPALLQHKEVDSAAFDDACERIASAQARGSPT